MNILKIIFGNSKEKESCCDLQIIEVKENQDAGDKATIERECCPSISNRECC
jgi:hypothetical protein